VWRGAGTQGRGELLKSGTTSCNDGRSCSSLEKSSSFEKPSIADPAARSRACRRVQLRGMISGHPQGDLHSSAPCRTIAGASRSPMPCRRIRYHNNSKLWQIDSHSNLVLASIRNWSRMWHLVSIRPSRTTSYTTRSSGASIPTGCQVFRPSSKSETTALPDLRQTLWQQRSSRP